MNEDKTVVDNQETDAETTVDATEGGDGGLTAILVIMILIMLCMSCVLAYVLLVKAKGKKIRDFLSPRLQLFYDRVSDDIEAFFINIKKGKV